MSQTYTDQTAFDAVYKHLLTQDKKSQDYRGKCVYRDTSGLKCAIGALIPDELYEPRMDGTCNTEIKAIIPHFKQIGKLFAGVNQDLLADLQGVHDYAQRYNWAVELKAVAAQYGLTVPTDFHADGK